MIFDLIMAAAGAAAKPAPVYVARSFAEYSQSGSLSISKPTGVVEGDIMIAFLQHSDIATWTPPAGWTEVLDQGSAPSISVAYKIATASEGASYAFGCSLSAARSGHIFAYRGGDFDAIGSVGSSTGTSITIPGITVSSDNSLLLCLFAHGSASASATSPSGMTAVIVDTNATAPSSRISFQAVGAGATGSKTFTSSSGDKAAVLLSIKPA